MQTPLVEVNELGPSIQQGAIQRPIRKMQPDPGAGTDDKTQERGIPLQRGNIANHMSGPSENGGDRLPSDNRNSISDEYVLNCIHGGRPVPYNEIARPVFVNHYYANEPILPTTNKKYIRLDECDDSTETLTRNSLPQASSCKIVEQSRNSQRMPVAIDKEVGSEKMINVQN